MEQTGHKDGYYVTLILALQSAGEQTRGGGGNQGLFARHSVTGKKALEIVQ